MSYKEDFNAILDKAPLDLLNWLGENFQVKMPEAIVTEEDAKEAAETMLKCSGYHTYLLTLLSYAKLQVRDSKRNKSKEEYEDMIDRRDIIENFKDIVKHNYLAVSRAVTIYLSNKEELRMGRGII